MEGLVSCGINNPVRVFGFTKQRSRFLFASSTPHLKTVGGFRIGMVLKKKKQCSPLVVAAAASVGGSQVGQFENTIPSKGFYINLIFYYFFSLIYHLFSFIIYFYLEFNCYTQML